MGDQRRTPLKRARIERGLTQTQLAREAGISRQALGAIEAGLYQPSVGVALKLSRVLGVSVEHLFADENGDAFERVTATVFEPEKSHDLEGMTGFRPSLYLARVGGRVVAAVQPPVRFKLEAPAGIIERLEHDKRADVVTFWSRQEIEATALLAGCDPAGALLEDYLRRPSSETRLVCVERSSAAALNALRNGFVHIAGVHLRNSGLSTAGRVATDVQDFNVEAVAQILQGEPSVMVHFAQWELGLAFKAGNPLGIKQASDIVRKEICVALREPGSGAHQALSEALVKSGVELAGWPYPHIEVRSHLEAAAAIAQGRADVAATVRVAADAFGLGFLTLRQERYDLVILKSSLDHPAVRAVLEALNSSRFARQVSSLCGYDTSKMGTVVESS